MTHQNQSTTAWSCGNDPFRRRWAAVRPSPHSSHFELNPGIFVGAPRFFYCRLILNHPDYRFNASELDSDTGNRRNKALRIEAEGGESLPYFQLNPGSFVGASRFSCCALILGCTDYLSNASELDSATGNRLNEAPRMEAVGGEPSLYFQLNPGLFVGIFRSFCHALFLVYT